MNLSPYLNTGLPGLRRLRKHIRRGRLEHLDGEAKGELIAGLAALALADHGDSWLNLTAISCFLACDCRNLTCARVAFRRLRQRVNRRARRRKVRR